jgi:hypothetical protein
MLAKFCLILSVLTAEPTISEATIENGVRCHRITSEFQSGETQIRVLLPDCHQPGELLTTLYLLPVQAKTETRYGDGMVEAQRLNLANKHRLICVAPTFSHLPWYADHPHDKTIRQESYFLNVVIPAIEKLYPACPERCGRLLVGFSKSGYGAWSLLLRHPDRFAKAAAWDAPLMKTLPDQFGMGPIYGSAQNFQNYRLDCLLRECPERLRVLTDKPAAARLVHLGYGNFRDHHQRAELLLTELNIPRQYADGPKRDHTWHSGWLDEAVNRLCE